MEDKIVSGVEIAKKIREGIKSEVERLEKKPGLAAVLVGDNPASRVYVGIKRKHCEEVGIYSEEHKLPEDATEEELFELIEKLNNDSKISAILIQLPVPSHISTEKMFGRVALDKDVDGFNPVNVGRLVEGNESSVPCTPGGIVRMLDEAGAEPRGKHAVVVGRSNIVGKPVAMMLLNRDATVTVCHSKTRNLAETTRRADILIVAAGKPGIITGDMIKEGAFVVDVGINKVDGKLRGDVDFESVMERAGKITPVPGGVGPMTVATLLENTLKLWKKQNSGEAAK